MNELQEQLGEEMRCLYVAWGQENWLVAQACALEAARIFTLLQLEEKLNEQEACDAPLSLNAAEPIIREITNLR